MDWTSGFDLGGTDWTSGFDLGGGGDVNATIDPVTGTWTSGSDLPSGGLDTGATPPSSFNVGPGQIPSDIYNQLIQSGLLTPGANVPTLTGHGLTTTPGSSSGGLGSILSSLGGLPGLLSLLGLLGGGIYAANQGKRAAGQTVQGINNANQQISSILGPGAGISGGGGFAPYIGAGQQALGRLGNFTYQPLAPQFGNLSTGGVNALPQKLTLGMLAGGK